jgi:hypothetical protein
MKSLRKINNVTVVTVMLLLMILVNVALAAEIEITQTWVAGESEPTSTVGGVDTPPWGWPNVTVPGGVQSTSGADGGLYRFMTNYWNTDTVIAGTSMESLTMEVTLEEETGEFTVVTSPDSYYPSGRTEGSCHAEDPGCNWTPNNGHAPASYPSIYKGCHWGQCSEGWGAPFPMKVSEIASLPSSWEVDLGLAGTDPDAAFNVAYDIWLDQNTSGDLPDNPEDVDQNDGAEIMIWLNNRGYDEVSNSENPIRPAGTLVQDSLVIPGVPGTWDVWIEPEAGDDVHWRIISYVREDRVTLMDFDSKLFLEDAMTRDCGDGMCVHPSWWLTSVQAGFEIWSNGEGLTSEIFTVEPVAVTGEVTGIARTDDGRPIVHWAEPFTLKTAGCADGTATFTLTPTDGDPLVDQPMDETPDSSGVYVATVGPVQPRHGDTVIDINISCPDGSNINQSVPVFIDPSGFIIDTNGRPVEDATVTLYRQVGGSWYVAPPFPWIMDPAINPQITLADGRFGWDVVPGTYKVRAEKDGCHAPGDPSQPYVETGSLPVPPEYTNIYLYLQCDDGTGGDDLDVQVLPMSDWETGYCRTVIITNNTDDPVDWTVTFELVDGGTINNFWNVIWSQSGNMVTAEGVSWNNILQPGESTHSLGFCATR